MQKQRQWLLVAIAIVGISLIVVQLRTRAFATNVTQPNQDGLSRGPNGEPAGDCLGIVKPDGSSVTDKQGNPICLSRAVLNDPNAGSPSADGVTKPLENGGELVQTEMKTAYERYLNGEFDQYLVQSQNK